MIIRPINVNDVHAVCEVYNHYVRDTVVTFEEVPVTIEDMQLRVASLTEKYPWLVCEKEGNILGYAYVGPWKSRAAYRYAVESSVYLRHDALGQGVGTRLYESLFKAIS